MGRAVTPARTVAAAIALAWDTSPTQETAMQVEAIYDHGKLEFIQPLRLKNGKIRLVSDRAR